MININTKKLYPSDYSKMQFESMVAVNNIRRGLPVKSYMELVHLKEIPYFQITP